MKTLIRPLQPLMPRMLKCTEARRTPLTLPGIQGNYSNSHVRSCQNENKNKAKQNNIMSRTSTLICDFTDELKSVQSKALFNFFCH